MGGPDRELPLDLDSSPWRRWSPILLDVAVVLVSLHVLRALLVAFYPYGMMVGWYRDRGEAVLGQLTTFPTGMTGLVVLGLSLFLLRVGSGLLGWHRLIFCIAPLLVAVLWHALIPSGHV